MSERGILESRGCKHHTLILKMAYQDIKDVLEGKSLKVSSLNLGDEIDLFLQIDPKDEKLQELNKSLSKETK